MADEPINIPIIDKNGNRIAIKRKALEMFTPYVDMIDQLGEEAYANGIPNQYTEPETLEKIVEWCTHHMNDPKEFPDDSPGQKAYLEEHASGAFDETFMAGISNEELPYLISQVNHLQISSMLTALNREFASRIKGKSPEQIRNTFEMGPPLSEEEQERLRQEFAFVTQ